MIGMSVAILEKSTEQLSCPRCASPSYRKDGFIDGRQRYRCKKCSKRFYGKKRVEVKPKKIVLPSIDSLVGVPCFCCVGLDRGCDVVQCGKMNEWVDELAMSYSKVIAIG